MQRMITHADPLPTCSAGHPSRHIHDARGASAGGGYMVECECSRTPKHPEFDDALADWCRANGHATPQVSQQRTLQLGTGTLLPFQKRGQA